MSAWVVGLGAGERGLVHERLRAAQAALSLQRAFQTGSAQCSVQATPELQVRGERVREGGRQAGA